MPYTSFRSPARRPGKSPAPHAAPPARLAVEALEDRSLPSATMVTQFGPADALTDLGSGVAFENDLYFTATVGQTTGLYKSDGTAAGTVLVKALTGGSAQANPQFTVVNGTLFFVWNNDLWESDGTTAGTAFVKDFGGAQAQSPDGLTNFNGTLYFTAPDLANPANPAALWKTDGTAGGTVEVNLAPNAISDVFNLTASGGKLFFQSSGTSVWESDGTAAGTALLPRLPGSASDVAVGNGVVYYAYGYQAPGGEQFDVGAINGGRAGPLGPDFAAQAVTDFTFLNNKLFFLAQAPDSSWQLWESGGPNGPLSLIASFGAGYDPTHGNLPDLTAYNGEVYFAGSDANHGVELWQTDGTAAGTVLVDDVNPGPQGSDPRNLTVVNGTLFFMANDGSDGEQLWALSSAPPLSATGQPITTVEGLTFSGPVATFTDPNPLAPASYTATITWGDGQTSAGTVSALGNGQFSVSGSNTYAQTGTYNVSVQIGRAGGGGGTAATTATVASVASGGLFATTAGQPFSGVVGTFTDLGASAATADTATIHWGDGHVSAGTIAAKGNGLFAVSGTNTYANGPASYPVVVNISLTGGRSAYALPAALVSSSASGPPIKAVEGQPFSGVLTTFSDPNPAAASDTATVTWGDGQTSAGTVTALGGGRFAVSGGHAYAHAGNYAVSVQIDPAVGGSLSAAAAVTVALEPFWATRTFQHAKQWQPVTGTLGTLTDLNPLASAGDFTVTINWGDGTNTAGTLQPTGPGTFAITGGHIYTQAGARALAVTVTGEGGRTATTNPLITVDAAPPPLSAAGQSITTPEGQPFSGVVATFADLAPQGAGAYAAAIRWGDGQTSAGTVAALGNGRYAVSGGHAYAHAGTYAVGVQLSRPGGVSAAAAATAYVTEVPFWATRTFQHFSAGRVATAVLGTLADLNPLASAGDFTVTIDWGDGTKSPGLLLPKGNGTFTIAGTHDYASVGARPLGVTVTDEAGRTVTTNPLVSVDPR